MLHVNPESAKDVPVTPLAIWLLLDGVNPDDVIMSPSRARDKGLTSTVTFPRGNLAPEGSVIKSTAIDPSVVDKDGFYRKIDLHAKTKDLKVQVRKGYYAMPTSN